jgi:ABC-type transporter Mla subunit MlaD
VRKNGILIGRVKSIEEQEDGMLVRVRIEKNRPLYAAYEPHIRTTVIGDATIDFEFDFKRNKRLPADAKPVEDGFVFTGIADESPFDAITKFADLKQDFAEAAHSLDQAGDQVAKLASRLNDTLGDETKSGKLDHLVETTDRAMAQFANTMNAFNDIFGDLPPERGRANTAPPAIPTEPSFNGPPATNAPPYNPPPIKARPMSNAQPAFNPQTPANLVPPANVAPQNNVMPPPNDQTPEGREMRLRLRQSLNELPDAIHELRQTLSDFRVVLESANKNFKNLEGFTEALGQKGADIAASLLKAVSGIDQLVTDLNALTQAINNKNGTIGRLLNDDQLYQNVNVTMYNVNQVLGDFRDLMFRLKPVVADARIFMDKIAVEPGRIIGGAVRPSTVK